MPRADQLGVIQPADKPGEWWVTVDGKCVIGFTGSDARTRAEHELHELLKITAGQVTSRHH